MNWDFPLLNKHVVTSCLKAIIRRALFKIMDFFFFFFLHRSQWWLKDWINQETTWGPAFKEDHLTFRSLFSSYE